MIHWKRLAAPLIISAVLISLLTFVLRQVVGRILSARVLKHIEGKTRVEVLRIAGEPRYIYEDQWVYEVPWNPGWVEVHFDGHDRVNHVNDESPFPELSN